MDLPKDEMNRRVAISCDLVAAYLRFYAVPVAKIPGLIALVHYMMESLRTGEISVRALVERPAVRATQKEIRASITHDALISFEDGRPYKTLKRHLTALGLTPEIYRAKWGLPADYPMVSAGYAKRRSELAKSHGLGRLGSRELADTAE